MLTLSDAQHHPAAAPRTGETLARSADLTSEDRGLLSVAPIPAPGPVTGPYDGSHTEPPLLCIQEIAPAGSM
jgi:hypothetical protein